MGLVSLVVLIGLSFAGCGRSPRVSISMTPATGGMALLRCRAEQLKEPLAYRWSLSGCRTAFGGAPLDGPALMIQLTGHDAASATCTVESGGITTSTPVKPLKLAGKSKLTVPPIPTTTSVSARLELGPLHIDHARRRGERITLEGSGFGPAAQPGDALHVASLSANLACSDAAWSDRRIVACIAAGAPAKLPLDVYLQAAGRVDQAKLEEIVVPTSPTK